ncbi:MAG: sensor histidine kinase [Limnochordia bacterium]
MSWRTYLRDHLPFVALFVGFALVTVAVVELDLRLSQGTLQWVNALYILLFALVALSGALLTDYYRQKPFLVQLGQVTGSEPLDQLGLLAPAHTAAQALVSAAWERLYGRLRAELVQERTRSRHQIDILSQWAHHMKTPVSVIDLELQKAHQESYPPEVQAVMDSIREENQRLNNSLQALLNMVRLEDFATDLRIERVDLDQLVRSLVNAHKREFITRRVYPQVEVGQGAGTVVETDAKWLRFVLQQVLSNALKYAAPAPATGQICFRLYQERGETLLSVEDNGPGIPPEDLPRVCQPFFTGQNGRLHPAATGMGLYFAAEVCRRLDHRLVVESLVGQGTTVRIGFPAGRTIFSDLEEQAREMPLPPT